MLLYGQTDSLCIPVLIPQMVGGAGPSEVTVKEALDHFEIKPLKHAAAFRACRHMICADGEIHSLQALRVGRAAVGRGHSDRGRVWAGDVEGVEVQAKLANVGPGARADLECSPTRKKTEFQAGFIGAFCASSVCDLARQSVKNITILQVTF